jgi:glycosyltransferase involved in cell wall biosynthesis
MEVTPRRVLYVITKSNWGGAQRYVYDLAVAAHERGDEVLVAAGGDGELLSRLRARGIPTRSVRALGRDVRLLQELTAVKELTALMREFRPDVVHINSSKAGLAALAGRLTGVPRIIFTVHGWAWNEDRPFWQKLLLAAVYQLTLMLCHRVVVVSHAAHRQARFLPFVQSKFVVIHNGVHPISFTSREAARSHLLPWASNAFWIGTIAELHPVKGLPVLIRAFKQFLQVAPTSQLLIMGEGQDRTRLEHLIAQEHLHEQVHLVGHVPEAAALLPALDIFVLPSRSEGLAYVLLEAGQARLPVVASAVGGIPEIITDHSTGVLVPYGDVSALSKALGELHADPARSTSLADTLHATVERDFSLYTMIEHTFAEY